MAFMIKKKRYKFQVMTSKSVSVTDKLIRFRYGQVNPFQVRTS
jgi:hypothetical protein